MVDELADLIEEQRIDDLWGHRVSRPNQVQYIDSQPNPPLAPRLRQPLSAEDSRHGTISGYKVGCKCDDCRRAMTRDKIALRNRHAREGLDPDDPRHGTKNGYTNLGCKCDRCRKANTDYHREYMRRRRAKLHEGSD